MTGAGPRIVSRVVVADFTRPMATRRPGGRTALVMPTARGSLFAELFEAFQKEAASPVRHQAFPSLDLALDWIRDG